MQPLSSCAKGGRKVVMLAEFGLAKDVVPRFQLYNSDGERMSSEEESLLEQPLLADISVMRESIVFITPPQPQVETIRSRGYTIKLVARRTSDGYVSKKKFDFDYLPHDYYDPCFFCFENPDNNPVSCRAKLVPMKEVARPGLRKRQMSGSESADIHERKILVKGDDHIKIETMNRIPVIKTTPSNTNTTLKRILPAPSLTLIPVKQLQKPSVQFDSSNNIEKHSIKTEPIEDSESSSSSIPFHDISKTIVTFPMQVVTTSLLKIKKEL